MLSDKINNNYCDMYLDEIVEIIGVINLYDEDKAIKLYKETKECIKYYFRKDALKAYESIDNPFETFSLTSHKNMNYYEKQFTRNYWWILRFYLFVRR